MLALPESGICQEAGVFTLMTEGRGASGSSGAELPRLHGAIEQLDLVDVRRCDYDAGGMAHLLYEVRGEQFSLFVIPDARHADRSIDVVGHQTQCWSSDTASYVLVSEEQVADMDKGATYMRGYDR